MNRSIIKTLLFLIGTSLSAYGQTLEVDEIDEFTKHRVKKTSYETLYLWKFTAYCRVAKVEKEERIDLKLMIKGVFSIDKDAEFMFKLDNDEIVTLKNLQYEITCNGCGSNGYLGSQAQGLKTSYGLTAEQHDKLRDHRIVKIRIYTSDGYVEGEIKEKTALTFQNALRLVE